MKSLHLDLVRVTEAGAIAASRWVGSGLKQKADEDATRAMRLRLDQIDFRGEVVIGEGKKDRSFGLFGGEKIGSSWGYAYHSDDYTKDKGTTVYDQSPPEYGIAIDPIDGTTPTVNGGYEAVSTIALGRYDAFLRTEAFYMRKLAIGQEVLEKDPGISLRQPLEEIVHRLSDALAKERCRITICVLDRPRHGVLINELRNLGVRIKLITDCDVTACIATNFPQAGIDMYLGVGGAPEAVLAAAAMKCLGGKIECQIADAQGMKYEETILGNEDLAKGEVMFCATGITDGKLLKGVEFIGKHTYTHSIAMRSESHTVRQITTQHGN